MKKLKQLKAAKQLGSYAAKRINVIACNDTQSHNRGVMTTMRLRNKSAMTRKVAFTLAEVLITLAIIGVVAALTIPTLISNYKKNATISKLKKVYSTMAQALLLSEIDNGKFSTWNITDTTDPVEYVTQYWLPYFKGAKICNTFSDCGYSLSRPWKAVNNVNVSEEDVTGTTVRSAIQLSDGTVISFRIPPKSGTQGNTGAKINIDINGSQPPNRSGIDYFWMTPSDKGVRPYGIELTTEEINPLCYTGGIYCFAKIVNDGWQIKDDYPW